MTAQVVETPLHVGLRRTDVGLEREIRVGDQVAKSVVDVETPTEDALGDWWRAHFHGNAVRPVETRNAVIRTADLFCGSGGLAVGFDRVCAELGLRMRSQIAIDHDDEVLEVYSRNHHAAHAQAASVSMIVDYRIKGSRDAATFRYQPELLQRVWKDFVGEVDVVLAGPPCQGHSSLNNFSRRSDRRNELYLTVPAIAIALEAPMVIIENVPAVVHDRLGVAATTQKLLENAGYTVEIGVLRAEQMGWAQSRSRYFLVAARGISPLPIPLVADALADEPRSVMWAIGDLEDEPADDGMHRHPVLSFENQRRIDWLFAHNEYDLPLAERPECHQNGTTYNAVYGRLDPERPAPTITTGFMTPGQGRFTHPTRPRVLTPREAARLQGFPDPYCFDTADEGLVSSRKLRKWIGDAVPMPLGYAAGLSLLAPRLRKPTG